MAYYDLSVSHTLLEPQTQRERVSVAIKNGWDAVGLVHQAVGPKLVEQQDRCGWCLPEELAWHEPCPVRSGGAQPLPTCPPFPTHTPPLPPPPLGRCTIRPVELQALLTAVPGVREALAAAEQRGGGAGRRRHGDPYSVLQLTRINIPMDDPASAQVCKHVTWLPGTCSSPAPPAEVPPHPRPRLCPLQAACSSATARRYDLVAVQPQSERLFALACASLDADLIALDLSRRLPFRFKTSLVRAALARGLHFEVGVAGSAGWGEEGGDMVSRGVLVGGIVIHTQHCAGWAGRTHSLHMARLLAWPPPACHLPPPPPTHSAKLQICFAPALRDVALRRQLCANALALCREIAARAPQVGDFSVQ